jgi:hypothetical protein
MVRLIWKSAHVASANVQQVARICCEIGYAAADLGALFDQCHAKVMLGAVKQMASEQNATRATANYDHVAILTMKRWGPTSREMRFTYFVQAATSRPLSQDRHILYHFNRLKFQLSSSKLKMQKD